MHEKKTKTLQKINIIKSKTTTTNEKTTEEAKHGRSDGKDSRL